MKEKRIKPLPIVKTFIDYFVHRGKRVLKLKDADFETASIDVHPERGTIWVWFHGSKRIIARVYFTFDGHFVEMLDYRIGG